MDLVFSVNSTTQDIRYGDPATGALSTIQPLGFACYRLVVMPGQRYVYISGNKLVGKTDHHAWFAAFDTCTGTVVKELDLGPGFGGQIAVPGATGGSRAFVSVAQKVGTVDTGPYGGSSRIEVLNIVNPADPLRVMPPFQIPPPPGGQNDPYGPLHLVWSVQRNRLYTTHRGNGWLYSIDPLAGSIQPEFNVQSQPTGMALSRSGFILYVGRRVAGDILGFDITGQTPALGGSITLPQGRSDSVINLAVDAQDRIIATSAQRASTPQNPNPNPNPVPGQVFVIDPMSGSFTPRIVDTQGTWLGQPAPTPDASHVFVPRGDQNDIVDIDPAPNPPTVSMNPVTVGHSPTDAVAVDHVAGQTLSAIPAPIQGDCDTPQQVTIRAYDACGNEMQGIPIRRIVTGTNPSVTPAQANTPATFDVQCTGHGATSITFTTVNVFPLSTLSVPVECQCPQWRCFGFVGSTTGPIPPTHLAGAIPIQILFPGVGPGPDIVLTDPTNSNSGVLRLYGGTVGFTMPASLTADGLIVHYTRHDPITRAEVVTVTHAGGTTPVANTMAGQNRGDFEIACPFSGITSWTIAGGAETWITEICLLLTPGSI